MEYPLDSQGEKMKLLAQINFTQAALEDERLPKQGMLQFFLSTTDDCYGMDFDEPDKQKDFRVIYHENINLSITEAQILALDIPIAPNENDEWGPVFKEVAVEIKKTTAYLGLEDYRFVSIFKEVVKELFGEDIEEQHIYNYLDEDEDEEYLWEECSNTGHWILGYPYFTQSDPRGYEEKTLIYDTLLFQMDSEMGDDDHDILWGDSGVGNFFINEKDLRNKDFSKVLYNWDCC